MRRFHIVVETAGSLLAKGALGSSPYRGPVVFSKTSASRKYSPHSQISGSKPSSLTINQG